MIVDTHTHFYDPSRPQGVPWPRPDNELLYRTVLPAHYGALAEPEGVTGTVVVEASAWLEDNQWVLDLAAENPFLLALVGHVDPGREAFRKELDRFVRHPRFRGIRCGGRYFEDVQTGSFLDDMSVLVERDLALDVLVHAPQIDGVLALARRVPELRIIIDHIAHMPIDGQSPDPVWVTRYRRLAAQPSIYLKVSGLMEMSTIQPAPVEVDFYRPALDALWDAFGPQRLIYGSNWPVCERAGTFGHSMNIVQTYWSGKDQADRERFFWRNASTVYKWPSFE
jgi:L-fuconolactonase